MYQFIRLKILASGLLIAAVMLAPTVNVFAEGIAGYSPLSWDYGDLTMGDTAVQIFSIESGGLCGGDPVTTDLTIYAIYLGETPGGSPWPYEGDAFAITAYPSSYTVTVGTFADIEVTFFASSLGLHEAYVYVLSNACNDVGNAEISIPIQGNVVPDEADPTELMADLLAFLDSSAGEGSLVGDGPGRSAAGRLKAFGNMLEAADDLIAAGEFELACGQLQDALDRTDGLRPPPDFVDGEHKVMLALKISDVMNALGCP